MDNQGWIHTWSLASGKHLYETEDPEMGKKIRGYEIFRGYKDDVTYTKNFYN